MEEQLRTQLPVLKEVVERRILAKDIPQPEKKPLAKQATLFDNNNDNLDNKDNNDNPLPPPNHILIEGDNLHALTALTFTHEGQIDVMYFDPPYNTGNKDFKYNDSFVDREDSYRHSKWLSFMDKRLRIAKRLLSEKGVVFISIDDNEQAQLKLLCDEIFGELNFVANINWQKVYSPRMDAKGFSTETENIVCYSKSVEYKPNKISLKQENKQFKFFDTNYNQFYRRRSWRKEGSGSNRSDRPNLFYPISIPNGNEIFPIKPDGIEGRWRGNMEYFLNLQTQNLVEFCKDKSGTWQIYIKQFLEEDAQRPPTTLWLNDEVGHTHEASEEIKSIFGSTVFATPKPLRLLKKIFSIGGFQSANILDFFAGSGTTLHATMQLNAEDGGNRQCILVTNNENNIAEDVCYERNRRVIQGYTNSKGEWVPGLTNNNLRYYKSEFVGREPILKNKRELTRLATELLCIKEDCYEEQKLEYKNIRYFSQNFKRLLVIYDDDAIETAVELIRSIVAVGEIAENSIKVYVFSPGQYPFTEEFEEVLPWIKLSALPDAIYKAYMNILPGKNPGYKVPELTDENDSQAVLFEED